MFTTGVFTLVLLAVASVNGSPTSYDKRDPQFTVNLPNRLPITGSFRGFNITTGANGNSVVNFGSAFRGQRVNGNGGARNATRNGRPFPFNFLPFKRDGEHELVARDPQLSFNFPNRLPVEGNFGGFNITRGPNGNSIINFGSSFRGQRVNNGSSRNRTTNARPFPFNFLPFKRDDELVKRDPQFSFNFHNRLPVEGNFNEFNITRGANGNSIVNFGQSFRGLVNGNSGSRNTTSSTRPFPFNFLPFKRDAETVAARDEIEAREPQFSVSLHNKLSVSGKLPFGFNIAQGANANSVASFGNATTGDRGFPFSLLPFKREDSDDSE